MRKRVEVMSLSFKSSHLVVFNMKDKEGRATQLRIKKMKKKLDQRKKIKKKRKKKKRFPEGQKSCRSFFWKDSER